MVQTKKKGAADRPAEKASDSKAVEEARKGRWPAYIIASVVIIVILIIVGIFYYQEYVAPYRITIIRVDDTSIDMGYFLKRTKVYGADPITMLDVLTDEQIIKLAAPRYIGEVTPEDIDQELRRQSQTTSDNEFREWYRQQLNESEFSDSEYRDLTGTYILRFRLHEYLAKRVPTVAEQVHLHGILLATYEDAEKTRARWEAGEDFADLAREVSLDNEAGEKGGDLGWFPSGVLNPTFEYVAFNLIGVGEVSEPVPYVSDPSSPEAVYYLLMISEKADAREINEDALEALRANVLEDWLLAEIQFHEVSYHGFNNGFDSETNAWMNWQLSKP